MDPATPMSLYRRCRLRWKAATDDALWHDGMAGTGYSSLSAGLGAFLVYRCGIAGAWVVVLTRNSMTTDKGSQVGWNRGHRFGLETCDPYSQTGTPIILLSPLPPNTQLDSAIAIVALEFTISSPPFMAGIRFCHPPHSQLEPAFTVCPVPSWNPPRRPSCPWLESAIAVYLTNGWSPPSPFTPSRGEDPPSIDIRPACG
ncbi:hypothetical protein NMY22_g19970 [Coprinellus aureogranulatus]|nr:hypothetical protein NMY22_g19970 [Coprinellus aureogranulatus]